MTENMTKKFCGGGEGKMARLTVRQLIEGEVGPGPEARQAVRHVTGCDCCQGRIKSAIENGEGNSAYGDTLKTTIGAAINLSMTRPEPIEVLVGEMMASIREE